MVQVGSGLSHGWKHDSGQKVSLDVVDSKGAECAVPPTRVFCKKSLDLLDNKGVDFFGDDKEPITDSGGTTYDFWWW